MDFAKFTKAEQKEFLSTPIEGLYPNQKGELAFKAGWDLPSQKQLGVSDKVYAGLMKGYRAAKYAQIAAAAKDFIQGDEGEDEDI